MEYCMGTRTQTVAAEVLLARLSELFESFDFVRWRFESKVEKWTGLKHVRKFRSARFARTESKYPRQYCLNQWEINGLELVDLELLCNI